MQCTEVWGGNRATETHVELSGIDAWVFSKPYQGHEEGGDIHYLSSCASGRISRLLLADVSGHGSKVSSIAIGLRDLMRKNVNFFDQRKIVAGLNQQFGSLSSSGLFATAVLASYWQPDGTLVLSNAGHPSPMHYSASSNRWSIMTPESRQTPVMNQPGASGASDAIVDTPLGILESADYSQQSIKLGPDDLVVMYTDSLTESKDTLGKLLGEQGLLNVLLGIGSGDPLEVMRGLMDRIPGWVDSAGDDGTVIVLRPNARTPEAGITGAAKTTYRFLRGWVKG